MGDCSRSVHDSCGLEEPLAAEEERPWHPRVRHSQPDAPLSLIDVVPLIEQVDDIEAEQEFLPFPWQRKHMGNRKIVDRVRRAVAGIRLGVLVLRRAQSWANNICPVNVVRSSSR